MNMFDSPLWVLAVLGLTIVLAEWLVKNTVLKHLSTALLVILITAIFANLSIIPSASDQYPLYSGIFSYIAPLSIFYLLLGVSLKNLRKAGLPMLVMFLVGSLATMAGVLAGMALVGGESAFGELTPAIGGMFTGTYTGGSVNFNAVAIEYNVMENGPVYAGATAIDNIITALWLMVGLTLPPFLSKRFLREKTVSGENSVNSRDSIISMWEVSITDLAILLGLGMGGLWLAEGFTALFAGWGWKIPKLLTLTTIALILAQIPWIQKRKGAMLIGMFSIYLFLAVIGAYCELAALAGIGELAVRLSLFIITIVLVHGAIIYGVGAIFKWDWYLISIASQANIGGSSTAMALAKSFEREDLFLPAILVGSLGNGIGTYLGFFIAGILG